MNFQCIPVLGKDAAGNDVTMIVDGNGQSTTSAYIESQGSTAGWEITQIQSIAKSGSNLVALGYGSNPSSGLVTNIAWVLSGSTWSIGPSGVGSTRSVGVAGNGTDYAVADGADIHTSNFVFPSGSSPAGAFAYSPPTISSRPSAADSMVFGPVFVGASISSTGTWVGPSWTHEVGTPVGYYTGHYSTSYTFPGASGSDLQYQVVQAIPNGDIPTTTWGDTSNLAHGYYALTGAPTLTATWSQG